MTAREDEEFLNLGIQYYAAARSAVLAGLLPVFGNLYHHAIEAFLKARLSQKFTLKQLKDEKQGAGHKLPLLWNSFKAEFPGTTNSTIQLSASNSLRNCATLTR